MPRTYADFSGLISLKLQDAGAAIFAASEINYQIEESLKELSTYQPHIICVTFKIESRTGSATSTLANNLVDATESQFVSTDPANEKVVHNTTDYTWAVVETYTSATTLVLSKDIMASGENYEIYNKRCQNSKQIYIGDMVEYLGIDHVEYPRGTRRNFREVIDRQVLEIDVDYVDDSDPAETSSQIEVDVYFIMSHVLSQLTDWDGELSADAAADATSIAVDGLSGVEVVEQGSEFRLENHRTLYIVTADATLAAGAGTLAIYPPLEATASDNDDINFVRSSLKPHQEDILAEIVAARVMINKSPLIIVEVSNAIATLATAATALGNMTARITQAVTDIASGRTAAGLAPAIILEANLEIDKMAAEVALANTQLDTAVTVTNLTNKGGPNVPGQYAQLASGYLGDARGYMDTAQGFLQQAARDESVAGTYGGLAARELSSATDYLNQAIGYLRRVSTGISLASGWRNYQEWGERKLAEALNKLRKETLPRTNRVYSRAW